MKYLITALCTVLLNIAASTVAAQSTKISRPYLFKNFPAAIDFSQAQLSNVFSAQAGQNKTLALPAGLSLSGEVVSNISKYNGSLQTLTIKLPAFNNMLFSLSKRTAKDNSVIYIGHLFSKDYADGYDLKRNDNNTYQLIKVEMNEMLPACNQ
jgi:hypothetical protein